MNTKSASNTRFIFSEPATYQIKVAGELQNITSEKLKGMQIIVDRAEDRKPFSVLTGQVRDQADLSGLLNTIYELHLTIIFVRMLN